MSSKGSLSTHARIILGTVLWLLALLLLAGGWAIPFEYESFSILYKFGREKIMLRTGKVIGITILVLIFYQVILASRFQMLQQIFSVKWLLRLHRLNGLTIGCLVILHPLLIKASENFTPYTFAKKYYPEFMGIGLLTALVLLSVIALFRNFFKFSYPAWLWLHRLSATLVLVLLPTHILFVSETFKSGVPRDAALVIMALSLVMITRVWIVRFVRKGR